MTRKWIPVLLLLLSAPALAPAQSEALFEAAREGDTASVQAALAAGADVNAANDKGVTPLMLASITGHTEIVKALLAAKADPNTRTPAGNTALAFARKNKHAEVVAVLEKAGARGSKRMMGCRQNGSAPAAG